MIIIACVCVLAYLFIILYLVSGIKKYQPKEKDTCANNYSFSVIIPCKNEKNRLSALLASLQQLTYQKKHFELIFVDDYSEDSTYEILSHFKNTCSDFDISVLKNKGISGKKSALRQGIDHSKYQYIVTTDADCFLPDDWLDGFNHHLNKQASSMIIAPVIYRVSENFLEQFQHDDFLSLQAITLASAMHQQPILCNGANLCYNKSNFYQVKGFESHQHLPSGDDIFLMESFRHHQFSVDYINNKVEPVITQPTISWKAFLHQRKRWSSKLGKTQNKLNYGLLFLLGLFSLLFIFILLCALLNGTYITFLMVVILLKWILDYIMFAFLAKKLNILLCIRKMLLSSFIYPFWIVFFVIHSINKSYIWKGKKF